MSHAQPSEYDARGPVGESPLGAISLLCGLLSLACGFPFSIAAIVTGWLGMKSSPTGLGRVGLALGVTTLTINLLVACVVVSFYGAILGLHVESHVNGSDIPARRIVADDVPRFSTPEAIEEAAAVIDREYGDRDEFPPDEEAAGLIAHLTDEWGGVLVVRPTRDDDSFFILSSGPDRAIDTADDLNQFAIQYARIGNPTRRALAQAVDLIEATGRGTEPFPSDSEGAAAIAHLKDEWGVPLGYRSKMGGELFLVVSAGPDGSFDTADDLDHADDCLYAHVANATHRGMLRAVDAVERVAAYQDIYPVDGVGDAAIAGAIDEWGNPLAYRQVDDGQSYRIVTAGSDGLLDTDDDLDDSNFQNRRQVGRRFR